MSAQLRTFAFLILLASMKALSTTSVPANEQSTTKRVPDEWETQEAIWLQWPGKWEKAHETAFVQISAVIAKYEKLHIHYSSDKIREDARLAISMVGGDPDYGNIVWNAIVSDSFWTQDNGPVYVVDDSQLRVKNWTFDAWGGAFGIDIPYDLDNRVPEKIGAYLGLSVDTIDIVHERSNLEFHGVDTVMPNWSVLGDPRRNPGHTTNQAAVD